MSGTLRSWIHYCELRRGHGTQKEHMEVAERCWNIIGVHFPDVIKALNA
jgi:thymidylate synthase (FAD)